MNERLAQAFAKASEPQPRANGHSKEQEQDLEEKFAKPYVAPDPSTIQTRQWLYGHHYMRGVVTATVAPGGFGKTTLALHEAITMALKGLRVWYISAEDDIVELQRRIAAHLQRHNIARERLSGFLFVDDKISYALKIAATERFNLAVFHNNELKRFEAAIKHDKLDVVLLDPLVSFHSVVENDTSAMDLIIKRLGEIATRQNCGIDLWHHVRKPPSGGNFEITVHDARGAGAIVNAVRSCRVLNQMSKAAADAVNIRDEERRFYIRIDNGKANMMPPTVAKWMKLENVQIGNGDFVQALSDYEYVVQHADTPADQGWLRQLFAGGKGFRTSSQSPEWLGWEVKQHYGRSDHAWINDTIGNWQNHGFIKKEDKPDGKSKPRPHWVVGDIPPPDEENDEGELVF